MTTKRNLVDEERMEFLAHLALEDPEILLVPKLITEEEKDEIYSYMMPEEEETENQRLQEKIRYRKHRRANRVHKKALAKKNAPLKKTEEEWAERRGVRPKHVSLYRMRDNEKNLYPSKPVPRRLGNFLMEMMLVDYKAEERYQESLYQDFLKSQKPDIDPYNC